MGPPVAVTVAPERAADATPSVALGVAVRSRLPLEPGPFIGRQRDLARLDTVAEAGCRVVTLVGPGGMGKTRLSVRWASQRRAEYTGGVYFADLTSCRDDASFLSAVGAALEVPIAAGGPVAARVGAQLAGHGRMLLVLDNFEQLVATSATTVLELSTAAPDTTFLVTSREPLRIAGERVHELLPIGLPGASDDPAAIARSDAFRLLRDRVEAVRGTFEPAPAEISAAGALVRRLDGIPLAIELAASRLVTLGTRALLSDLSRGIDALGAGERGKPERHRTLRAAIDWSLALLTPGEALAFAEIGAFHGGLDTDAAAAVLSGPRPLERLDALREKALLRAYEPPGLLGVRRLAPYETLGSVAKEKLAAHRRVDEVRARHARHYGAVARALRTRLDHDNNAEAQRTLTLERDNMEAALEALLSGAHGLRDAGELSAWLVLGLDPVCLAAGAAEHTDALSMRVRQTFRKLPPSLEARLLEASASALNLVGQRPEAAAARAEAIRLARQARDRGLEGRLLCARARGSLGATAEVMADVEAALTILREHGLPRDRAVAANELAVRRSQLGDPRSAEALFLESVRAFRTVGDRQWEGVTLCQIAIIRLEGGRTDEARAVIAEAVPLATDGHGWNLSAMASQASGHLAHVEGDLGQARAAFERAIDVYRRVAHPRFVGIYLGYLGIVERERGELGAATELLEEACAMLRAHGEQQHQAIFLAHWGATLAWRGDETEARRRLAEARATVEGQTFRGLDLVLEIEEAHLDIALGARADADRDARAANAARKRAMDRLERCVLDAASGVDAHLSNRIARRALGAARRPSVPPRASEAPLAPDAAAPVELAATAASTHPTPHAGELVIERDARWLLLPGGERVGLSSRHLARRLLLALALARLSRPGAAVSHDELLEAGWPGERMHPASARNRLYVAMSTLRKMGLEGILESESDGYRLDPDVPLRLAE